MLSELLKQVPDPEAVMDLVLQFNRLLKKYSKCLGYEDAYNELLVFFLELIQSNNIKGVINKGDGPITNYIVKSVRSKYIKLSKALANRTLSFSELSDEAAYMLEQKMSYTQESDLREYWSLGSLTNIEEVIIRMIYEQGYSVTHIANLLGQTRQSVNHTKLRALRKIRKGMQNKD